MATAPSEQTGVLATTYGNGATAAVTTAYVSCKDFATFQAMVLTSTTADAFTAKLIQATDAAGTGSKDITDHTVTVAAGDAANAVVTIDLITDALDEDFTHIALSLTPTGATDFAATISGFEPNYAGQKLLGIAAQAIRVKP